MTNYWLVAYAQVAGGAPTVPTYGWKTTLTPYNDGAVWGHYLATSGEPIGDWQTITNSQTGQPINLAFALTTPTNTPAPCVENTAKYVQWPNLFGGLDVWNNGPWVLADDFVCTNSGPISDIHLWGSWLNNQPSTNTFNFWLAIYDNVAANPSSNFSHPGTTCSGSNGLGRVSMRRVPRGPDMKPSMTLAILKSSARIPTAGIIVSIQPTSSSNKALRLHLSFIG